VRQPSQSVGLRTAQPLAVGFDGSLVTSPLMVFANLYLLCWDDDKLKFILSFKQINAVADFPKQSMSNNKFPVKATIQ
jgi:hypothetical protein